MTGRGSRIAGGLAIALIAAPAAASEAAFTFVAAHGKVVVPTAPQPEISVIEAPNEPNVYSVRIVVSSASAAEVCKLTRGAVGKEMSIAVGCDVVLQAVVMAPLCEGIYLVGGRFTRDGAAALAARIRNGSPACEKPQQ